MNPKHPLPSDRSFGLTFAGVFAVLTIWLAYRGSVYWPVSLAVSGLFALLAYVFTKALHPLNVGWMWFGGVLNRVVSPVILGLIYFGIFTPVALVFRVRGRDALHRKFSSSASTYWMIRSPPGPDAERSFPRQF